MKEGTGLNEFGLAPQDFDEGIYPEIRRAPPNGHRGIIAFARDVTIEQKILIILLSIFAAKGFVVALIHQPFTGHDEVMHYAYLSVIAEKGRVPVIPDLGQWQQDYNAKKGIEHDRAPERLWQYCQFTTPDWKGPNAGLGFCTESSPVYAANVPRNGEWPLYPVGWIYTANHPPLYYLYMTPVYWLTEQLSPAGQLYFFRIATIPFGLITVLFGYLTVRQLFPGDRFLAITVPAFVAFQPQISYESSVLNNDIMAIAFTSVVLYLVVVGLKQRFPVRNCVLLGAFYGLAVLSKNTSLTAGVIIGFAMIAGLGWKSWRQWVPKGTIAAGTAGLIVWPWFLFMWSTYGDFTALGRIQNLQYWNYNGVTPPSLWGMLSNKRFFWARWQETWGDFGWRLIPLSDTLLKVIFFPVLLGVVGLGLYAVRFWKVQQSLLWAGSDAERSAIESRSDNTLAIAQWQVVALLTLGLTCVVAYFAILQFGLTFSLTQARYFFPAINAGAILLMLGVRSWFPRKWLPYVTVAVFLGVFVLYVYIYTGYVVPWNLTGQFATNKGF